jgi:hypothetical protein
MPLHQGYESWRIARLQIDGAVTLQATVLAAIAMPDATI